MGKWVLEYHNRNQTGYPIFCFPHAGAGASIYRNWQVLEGENINICPVQLPGREERIAEPIPSSIDELVEMIYEGINEQLTGRYSLFGHSMGGIIAYELVLKLQAEGAILPDILFMSGSSIAKKRNEILVSSMNDVEMTRYLWSSGGTDKELLQCQEFRNCYYPVIRGDYHMIEAYQPSGSSINCPIRAFAGLEDREVPLALIEEMGKYTDDFALQIFPGDHFFIRSSLAEIGTFMAAELTACRC